MKPTVSTSSASRAGRRDLLDAALVGYTNTGKSSLLRSLSGEHDIFVEDRLFATLDTLSREVELGEGFRARVFDTVGFIRKLPHNLVASFRATLEEVVEADLLLHVVDAASPLAAEQMAEVEQVLEEIGAQNIPQILIFNKLDLLEATARPRALRDAVERVAGGRVTRVFVSARDGSGLDVLRSAIAELAGGNALNGEAVPPYLALQENDACTPTDSDPISPTTDHRVKPA